MIDSRQEEAPPSSPAKPASVAEPNHQAVALPIESLAALTAKRSAAPAGAAPDGGLTLAPAQVEDVWRKAVAMTRTDSASSSVLLQLMAEASPLDCRDGQFRVAFPPEKSKLIAWMKRRDREAVERMLREASGARLRLAIVEEAIEMPVRTLGAPLVGRPSAPTVDEARAAAFEEARAARAAAAPAGRPAPPPRPPFGGDDEMVAEDAGSGSPYDSAGGVPFDDREGDEPGDFASPDYDEDYLKRVASAYGPPGKRLEEALTANQTLRDAVELARQMLKGTIVKLNGESLERERDRRD